MQSVNPATGKIIGKYKSDNYPVAFEKLNRSELAWAKWKETSYTSRSKLFKRVSSILLKRKHSFAELMALEMGKPVKEGVAEIEKCAWVCRYYAENGESFLKDVPVATDASASYVSYQPIGTILAVMPWNFPFWQVFRFIAPSIFAGNCGILKHASNVQGCAKAIEMVMIEAGFPEDVFQSLIIKSAKMAKIIEHPAIKAITLTGSTEAGQQVAAMAGGLIKKTVLELGGSDPYIILSDADLEYAATVCADSRLINNGQSCIAAKRFIVVRKVARRFTELLALKMSAKVIGDPLDKNTDLGPMSRIDLRDKLHQLVLKDIEKGAQLKLGGELPERARFNAFYPPTILYDVKPGMSAYKDEIFGPVASVIIAKDTQHAIEIANDSQFGLGAAIFTGDIKRGEQMAKNSIQAGSCFVNNMVKSDPRLPFGGIKMSGYGRELGLHGIHEFVNIKTVYIDGPSNVKVQKRGNAKKTRKGAKSLQSLNRKATIPR